MKKRKRNHSTLKEVTGDKEYRIIKYYNEYVNPNDGIQAIFELLKYSIENKIYSFLDLKSIKRTINADLKYLELYQRFSLLRTLSKQELTYDDNGFQLHGHTYESLDEVEKALDNKAFS